MCPRSQANKQQTREENQAIWLQRPCTYGQACGQSSFASLLSIEGKEEGPLIPAGGKRRVWGGRGRGKLTFFQSMMSFSLRKRKMPFPCDRAT